MTQFDVHNIEKMLKRLRAQAKADEIRVTQHAHQEMAEDDVVLVEVLQAISNGSVIENYPEHRRGACCLLAGFTDQNRPLHIVCTTAQPILIVITVYEPTPPKWITPLRRRSSQHEM